MSHSREIKEKRPSHAPPSHSCEGRNLIAEGANCRRRCLQFPAALRRRRFLPSQEWDGGGGENCGVGGIRQRAAAKSAAERKIRVVRRKFRPSATKSDKKTTADAHFCELFALFLHRGEKNGTAGRFRAKIAKASVGARY
ncbi:MAG: hypothetical protein ACR2QC_02800 [Gammaproteobacteria bacterium]